MAEELNKAKNPIERLLSLFQLRDNPDHDSQQSTAARHVPPLAPDVHDLKSPIDHLLHWWVNNVLESQPSSRFQRYDEYDFMVKNSAEVALAESTYIDETLQVNKYENPIAITTKNPKLQKWIEERLVKWKMVELLQPITESEVRYGECPVIPVLARREDGAYEIQHIAVIPIREFDREEATVRPDKDIAGRIAQIEDMFERTAAVSNALNHMYGQHLTGFRINVRQTKNKIWLPPWMLVHFRNSTSDRDFSPYGKSYLEPMRSVYRQLLAAETLMSIARATRFDRLVWKIPVDGSDPAEAFEEIRRFLSAYKTNVGNSPLRAQKEIVGLAEDIYIPKTQEKEVQIDRLGSSVNMDDIADIEYRRDKLYTAARLPKSFLLADSSSELHGDALVAQDEKFARLIFRIQHDLISGIIRLIQIEMALTGDWDPATDVFTVGLPFPVKRFSQDEIQRTRDKFDLVDTAVKMFEPLLDPETKIPLELYEQFLRLYSEIDSKVLDKILATVKKARTDAQTAAASEGGEDAYAQGMSGGGDPYAMPDEGFEESRRFGSPDPKHEWADGSYHRVSSSFPLVETALPEVSVSSDGQRVLSESVGPQYERTTDSAKLSVLRGFSPDGGSR